MTLVTSLPAVIIADLSISSFVFQLYTRNLTVFVPQSQVEEEEKPSKRSRSPEIEREREEANETFGR